MTKIVNLLTGAVELAEISGSVAYIAYKGRICPLYAGEWEPHHGD